MEVNVKSSGFRVREALSRATSLILGAFKSNHGMKLDVEISQNSSDETKSSSNRNVEYCVGSAITNSDEINSKKRKKRKMTASSRRSYRTDPRGCSLYNLSVWTLSILGFLTGRPEKRKTKKNKKISRRSASTNSRDSSLKENQLVRVNSTTEDSGFQYCYFLTCLGQEKLKKLLTRTKSQENMNTVRYLTSQAPRAVSRAMKSIDPHSRADTARLRIMYEDLTSQATDSGGVHARWKRKTILKEFTKKIDERSLKKLESHLKRKINYV